MAKLIISKHFLFKIAHFRKLDNHQFENIHIHINYWLEHCWHFLWYYSAVILWVVRKFYGDAVFNLWNIIWHFLFFIDIDLTGLEQHTSLCIILSALWYHLEIPVQDWSSTVAGTALHIKWPWINKRFFMPLTVTIQKYLERQQDARQGSNELNWLGIIHSSHNMPAP